MTDKTNETAQAPEPRSGPRRRNGVVAAAVVAVLAIGGGAAYLASSGSGHSSGTSAGSAPVVSASSASSPQPSPAPSGSDLQPGGPKSTSPSGVGIVQTAASYQAAGTELTVYFYAHSCMRYSVTADESVASQVTTKVVGFGTASKGEACSQLMYLAHATTTLKAPLNGRTVVDAATGKTLAVRMGQPGSMPSGRVTHGPVSVNS